MCTEKFADSASNGSIITVDDNINCSDLDWVEHPSFEGVYLKHLVNGKQTEGKLSCHLVRIDPDCTLETHTHDPQWELHETIKGYGTALISEKEKKYYPGTTAIVPNGLSHSIKAGKEGLTMLAKFFPALK